MKYAIVKEGFNDDGSYSLFLEQEFQSKEEGRIWRTSIMMIYSENPDNYDLMPDEYKIEKTREEHDLENAARIDDHKKKINKLTKGTEDQRNKIIKDLLTEHREALKSAGHLDVNNKSKHKNLTEEEIAEEINIRKIQQDKNKKEKVFKVIPE